MKLLVVEDEPKLGGFLKRGLEEQSWEVELAFDGQLGKKMATNYKFDLIILDVNLPLLNGYDLARQLRKDGLATPILFLTALGTIEDKLDGFEAGADDYLVKPFEFRELIARIKALVQRSNGREQGAQVLALADLELNLDEKVARRAGNRIDLTAKEFALLEYLMRNRGRVVSRVDIAEQVWDIRFDTGTNVIDVYINFLRKKVDKDYPNKLIHTVVGMGYIFKEE
ncbi:DNA-binding response OmpR family regulator [Dyadobacter jejuensis]|uniref:DNA-binding response OmpR family regulator n=1 Tax=Dyadobacter jejuensis TaxID=1082580 RepID=A0A316AP00_9BACT|nr:response regulator transcription factor [Dyadobacter jejuensis]PWJ59282.1 DNA-binding response OmpR family regulator [Dyadobacter jejuensis]